MWPAQSSRWLSSVSEACYSIMGQAVCGCLRGHTRSPSGVTTYCQRGPSQIPWETAAFLFIPAIGCRLSAGPPLRQRPVTGSGLFCYLPCLSQFQTWELTRLGVRQTFRTSEGTSYRVLAQGAIFAAVLLCSENNLSPLGQE